MKKTYLMKLALLAFSSAFVGCTSVMASMGISTDNISEYQSASGTPEDSVVFYGYIAGATSIAKEQENIVQFSQMNSNFPPDHQQMKKNIFVSKPVAPGSLYFLQGMAGEAQKTIGNTIWIYNETFPMQEELVPIVINVPKEPGLYFVGSYYDPLKLLENEVKKSNDKASEKICLKGALKLYKGTVWEKAIEERIKEL
ncbi:MAG: hypothetical protein J6I53_09305 [Treponema sp.]|nr:hypothetical protein [Treponema sp.]